MRYLLLFVLSLCPWQVLAQTATTSPSDLPRLKSFSAYRSSSNNLLVASNDDSKHFIAGETLVLADLKGPGTVTHIWITINHDEYAWPRLLRLRIYYDGAKTPSVDAPLGDFFGVGHGYERNLNSLMVRNTGNGRALNCYWPMPFRKSCKITVTNEGQRPLADQFYYHVDWKKQAWLPEEDLYFHAYYRQATPPPAGKLYTILDVKGAGHYVGTVLSVLQSQVGWFGEGDDIFYVDGEKTPRIEGTGTEDYFNDAWGLHVSDGPWTGTPVAEGQGLGARLTGYRWHVPDPVPFTKSLRVQIEHYGWTYNPDGTARSGFEERFDDFSSVGYWYQKGVNEGLPEPPYGNGRLPQGNALPLVLENLVQDMTKEKGEVSAQRNGLLFRGEGEGSRLDIPLDVPRDGRYELLVQMGQGPGFANGNYVTALDGKPTSPERPGRGPRPGAGGRLSRDIPCLGWFELTKGRHTLSFKCVGKDPNSTGYNLGISSVVLAEVGKFDPATSADETLPAATPAPPGIPVYRGQTLSYYMRRYEQAAPEMRPAFLRQIGAFGKEAAPAMQMLLNALSDQNPAVQQAACLALAQMGEKAGPAVPVLAKLLRTDDASSTPQAAADRKSVV
jgi:hypothetical protein